MIPMDSFTDRGPAAARLIPLMATGGAIYPLTVSFEPSKVPVQLLINGGVRLQGSAVASRPAIRKMLDFVVLHKIRPMTVTFPLNKPGIEKAFQILEDGKMRYRGVLVAGKQ
jgi:D-arabinose 1-dehydrogenase-like Zn-dependent alcohol dehydrogenase